MPVKPDPMYPKPEVKSLTNYHGVPNTAGENLVDDIDKAIRKFLKCYPDCDTRHVESLAVGAIFTACAQTRIDRSSKWRKAAIQSAKDKKKAKETK
jgi:hypothetical protein